jgi:hypothetical protein
MLDIERFDQQRAGPLVIARPDVAAFLRETGGGTGLETMARDAARASGAIQSS